MFKPGQSGNPGGRPKALKDVIDAARSHTKDAIDKLAAILRDKKAPAIAKVAAARELLDRGWGKAKETVDVHTPNGPLVIIREEVEAHPCDDL